MTRTDREIIEESLDHLTILESHLQRGRTDDPLVLDAACMRLSAAIEVLSHLPEERRSSLFGNDWHAMWSTRNRIAHAYIGLDIGITVDTLHHDIPLLTSTLRQAIEVVGK